VDRRRLTQIASGAAFLAVCAIAVLIVVSQAGGGSGGDTELEEVGIVRDELRSVPQRGTLLGDPEADVRITEYGDLQCPICREFSIRTTPGLIDGVVREGRASLDFRQLVVIGREPHAQSTLAAKAALAASGQDRYWNYVELFYRNQGTEESGYVTDEFLTAIARGAGVPDIPRWNRDRRDPRWDEALARTDAEAAELGFTATPSLLVEGPGGRQTLGVPTLEEVEEAVRAVE
jgi:protein-disulfide isomerase